MLSAQRDSPSSGVTNLMSGLSNWAWMTSPDQASQATMLPAARSWMYSLPVKERTWPLATTSLSRSIPGPSLGELVRSAPTPGDVNHIAHL